MRFEFEKMRNKVNEIKEENERQKLAEINRKNAEQLALNQKKLEQERKDREEFIINEKIFREAGVVELLEKIRDEKLLVTSEIHPPHEEIKNNIWGKEIKKFKVNIKPDPAEIVWSPNGEKLKLTYNHGYTSDEDHNTWDNWSELCFELTKDKQISFNGLTDPEEIQKEIAKIILEDQKKRDEECKREIEWVNKLNKK